MSRAFDSFVFGPWWSAQCRWILDDTEEVWRNVYMPGDDLSELPVQAYSEIKAKWTPKLLADYALWLEDPTKVADIPGPVTPTPKQARLAQEAKAALAAREAEGKPAEELPKPKSAGKKK